DGSVKINSISSEKKLLHLYDNLRVLVEVAKKRDIVLVIEPLNSLKDHKNYFLDNFPITLELIQSIDSEYLKILYDIYHMQIMEEYIQVNNVIMKITQKALFCFVLAIIVIYLLFPFYWALNSSFKTEAQLQMMPATFIPRDPESGNISFSLINYKSVIQNQEFLYGLINSSIVAISTTLLALVAGSFAGFAIGKLRFRGKQPSMYIILAMTMFPQITVLTGLFAIINTLKLEPRFSMILTYMIFTLPLTTWVLAAFFKSLPTAILESSQVDGATFFQT
ncbi:unnamed protein product, partial [marine sediment metagenome]